ncbi:D-alanyl-D-alanine carboxypeptidase [Brevundimonas lutea]|uniref:D-alanyl-D-alanine carboxypeptidase n=1 Tax=Brevundimonas lutea TaxID=2293980 RepID=UPI000F03CE5F|nr:D-alanyl-D-alanine carboxypeptidase [Brevundimonas lutea]
MIAFARRGLVLLMALGVMMALPTPGAPPPVAQADNLKYAAIVIDAESGEVLFARHATAPRYPASITKVMTLYLVFDALEQGKIKLDDRIIVSARAASQPPSKLGLAAGQSITVDDAIRSLAVRSANDMAVALAEHVAGSEARFTSLMTLKAQDLGMTDSRFVTANGLPDSRQLSSARDLAMLSRAVMRDFPQYYHYFGQQHWYFNGRQYNNTNGLLHQGRGVDGIKTGYTNASGYNLAASSVRDGRRLITVVLGGRSSATRNAHVAELMSTGFEVERLRAQGQLIPVAQTFFEQRGYGISSESSSVQYASITSVAPPTEGTGSDSEPNVVEYASLPSPAPTPAPTMVQASPAQPYAATASTASLNRGNALNGDTLTSLLNGGEARAAERRPTRAAAATAAGGRWSVQVGAFKDEAVARNWLTEVARRFRGHFETAESRVQTASGWYRSRFTGLSEDAARAACGALAERRVTCMVIQPD